MPTVLNILESRLRRAIVAAFGERYAETDPLIRPSTHPRFGDYQSNLAMSLGKTLGRNPRQVAQEIVNHLQASDVCDKVEIAGAGFINLTLSNGFLTQQLAALHLDAADQSDRQDALPGGAQTVVVDYSGPNVAKEMHVGHLRSTIIGDAIARVLEFQGRRVIRQNHLGDWGTQFGMLIEHLFDLGYDNTSGSDPVIADLEHFYRQAKEKFDADPAFAERARKRVVKLQSGDALTSRYWRSLVTVSKFSFDGLYRRLDVRLNDADIRGESFYNPLLARVVADLQQAGLLQESDGAKVVFPQGFTGREGDPLPLIVQKSDGGYLYATTDLAALRYRVEQLHADRIIYVTDARQFQHFAMVFAVARQAGWAPQDVKLEHVPFGTVLGEDGKPFKTRSGGTVKLRDLLDEAHSRALKIVQEKNPNWLDEQARQVAHSIGIGALKYADLANDRIKDYVFDWDRMLSFDGNTGPYLQNAYVRIQSIFRKAGGFTEEAHWAAIAIVEPAERSLALKLLQFETVVDSVAASLEPHRLCTYLYELASAFHQFYESCPVLSADSEAVRRGRLALCRLTGDTLRQALDLLGIGVVEQM